MTEDFHSYSLRYKEWLEDTVDESEVLPKGNAEVYYVETWIRKPWHRLLGLTGILIWDDYFDNLNEARTWMNEATKAGYFATLKIQPLR